MILSWCFIYSFPPVTASSGSSAAWLGVPTGVGKVTGCVFLILFTVSGRSAAWLARLLGGQEVPGSNPGAPTITTVTGH